MKTTSYKMMFTALIALFLVTGAASSLMADNMWDSRHHYRRDNYGYYDNDRYHHYQSWHHHRGYWDTRGPARIFINVE